MTAMQDAAGPGTIADAIAPLPPLPAETRAARAPAAPGELWSAARVNQRSDSWSAEQHRIREGYAPILDALGLEEDQNPAHFFEIEGAMRRNPILIRTRLRPNAPGWQQVVDRPTQEQLLALAIRGRRMREPGFLPGVPDDVPGLRGWMLERERERRARARETLSRSPGGFVAGAASFGGAMVEAQLDPPNLAATFIPTGIGRTILGTAAREALIGGAVELVQQPVVAQRRAALGEDFTMAEALANVGTAAAGSAVLGTALEYGVRGGAPIAGRAYDVTVESLFNVMPAPVQRRWASRMTVELEAGEDLVRMPLADVLGRMGNRDLVDLARDLGGSHLTPGETSAIHVLERETEIAEASPFEPGPAGDRAHAESLAGALERISRERPPALAEGAADTRGTFRLPPAPPAGAAPDFERQWSAIVGNEGGTDRQGRFLTSSAGAVGPAQVWPPTAPEAARLAGLPFDDRRYRTDHAYNIALGRAYYREQLRVFGDPIMAAAAYNSGPGSAGTGRGVRGAMARAARDGRPGEWEAYLPAETRQYLVDFRRRTGMAAGESAAAAPMARAGDGDAAEIEAMAAMRETLDPGGAAARGADEALFDPVEPSFGPALRRDLFGSDAEWADAQLRIYREGNDPESEIGPPAAGFAAPGREIALRRPERPGAESGVPAPDLGAGSFGPIRAYHGTSLADLTEILSAAEAGGASAIRGRGNSGIYFSRDPRMAWSFGDQLYEVEVDVRRPFVIRGSNNVLDQDRLAIKSAFFDADSVERLKSEGFDGVINEATDEIVVFDPKQVRIMWANGRLGLDGSFVTPGGLDAPALARFADPDGEGPRAQADSLEHDLRLEAEADTASYRLAEDGEEVDAAAILAAIDAEVSAAAAIRGCLT